ncbi:MAG: RNA polymerase sigma factor [Bacteroidetes bacterium]|nr:RNA polymerase sigma factor [Bacteroidota bacterium]
MIFSQRNTEAKRPDQASIGALYDKHAPWLLAVCLRYTGNREDAEDVLHDGCLRYTGNREDAEDVLHDGFMKIIRSIDSFKNMQTGSFEAWMRRIMVNTALNYIRDHKKEKMLTALDPEVESFQESDTDDFCGCDLSKEQLMNLVCELPAGYRTVFNLYVMEDYPHKEIGEMLGISENTSKSQLSKARNFLRRRLLEYQKERNYAKAESNR